MTDTNYIETEVSQKVPQETYSIGIYAGQSPFELKEYSSINPIVSRSKSGGTNVNFVADPFLIKVAGIWYLFYEVMPMNSRKGVIDLSISTDLINWHHKGTVLEESFHLSYPQVFEWQGNFFMIPESFENNAVNLYKSLDFPFQWIQEKTLVPVTSVDATILRHQNKWWLFVCDSPQRHDNLRLFFADDLYSDWTEHTCSPLYQGNNQYARPAGRIITWDNRLFRFAQDCQSFYGAQVNAFEIEIINPWEYKEKPFRDNPLFTGTGQGWNNMSMHHIDAHQVSSDYWVAVVDGRKN